MRFNLIKDVKNDDEASEVGVKLDLHMTIAENPH